jgi:hypothetical protein
MLERDLIENGTKETVIGCHCYEFEGDYYAFYEDSRIRYTTAEKVDLNRLPITVDGWKWESPLPRVKCKDCPFYKTCSYMDSKV